MYEEDMEEGDETTARYKLSDGKEVKVVESSYKEDVEKWFEETDVDVLTCGLGKPIAGAVASLFKKPKVYVDGKRIV